MIRAGRVRQHFPGWEMTLRLRYAPTDEIRVEVIVVRARGFGRVRGGLVTTTNGRAALPPVSARSSDIGYL